MMFQRLRTLQIDRIDVDEAIELVTFGREAEKTYAAYQVPTPEWLKDGIQQLHAEITRRRRDMLEMRRKEVQAKLTSLKSREERKAETEAELARLNDALGAP
jgi:hypothetical protein